MSEESLNIKCDGLLSQIHEHIELYLEGKKQFYVLVNEIDASLHGLSQKYSAYIEDLRDEWRILEEVNAIALDEGYLKPQKEHESLVKNTLTRFSDKLNLINFGSSK